VHLTTRPGRSALFRGPVSEAKLAQREPSRLNRFRSLLLFARISGRRCHIFKTRCGTSRKSVSQAEVLAGLRCE
jgi:hypothetical protein